MLKKLQSKPAYWRRKILLTVIIVFFIILIPVWVIGFIQATQQFRTKPVASNHDKEKSIADLKSLKQEFDATIMELQKFTGNLEIIAGKAATPTLPSAEENKQE